MTSVPLPCEGWASTSPIDAGSGSGSGIVVVVVLVVEVVEVVDVVEVVVVVGSPEPGSGVGAGAHAAISVTNTATKAAEHARLDVIRRHSFDQPAHRGTRAPMGSRASYQKIDEYPLLLGTTVGYLSVASRPLLAHILVERRASRAGHVLGMAHLSLADQAWLLGTRPPDGAPVSTGDFIEDLVGAGLERRELLSAFR
ncbi:MAG: hypothetical protein WBA45_12650 [Microthrixaceae bacterium]